MKAASGITKLLIQSYWNETGALIDMKLEFSAGGIIFKKEGKDYNFALILDSYGKWTFPKGQIEKGEKPEMAAVREVSEEIGLKDLKVIKLLDKIDYWFKDKTELVHKFVYYFLMEASEKTKLKPQIQEIKAVRWFTPKKALEVLGYKKDSEELLKKAIKELKNML